VLLALRFSAPPEHEAQKQSWPQPQLPEAQEHFPSAQQGMLIWAGYGARKRAEGCLGGLVGL
jgi:hypothetical protein